MEYEICGSDEMDLEINEVSHAEEDNDLPPEFCRYRDEGCELASSCLNCPFPRCLLDSPGGRQRWLKEKRDIEIVRLFIEGQKVKELARQFGLSERTVQRAIKRSGERKAENEAI
jgi:AraC-like DNA-binding protein